MSGNAIEDPHTKAAALGLVVVAPLADEVFVDVDSLYDLGIYEERLAKLQGCVEGVREVLRLESKTEGHFHIYVVVNQSLSPGDRIALQSLLGSDPVREMLGLGRILSGEAPEWSSLFFETPEGAAKVEEVRAVTSGPETSEDPEPWEQGPPAPRTGRRAFYLGGACAWVDSEEEARTLAAAAGRVVKEVQTLPYPSSPRLDDRDGWGSGQHPSFCHSPGRCAGHSACPMPYACSE